MASRGDNTGKPFTLTESYRQATLTFQQIRTANPAMQEALHLARDVAEHDIPVMLLGENGTGKNVLALAIHTSGPRRDHPFVSVNSSAIPEHLLESELFGHEKGAFTSADRIQRGRFEMAGRGTIFLDEVADLQPPAQAKILRVVEYRQFERVGGEATQEAEARLITATNRDIFSMVKSGSFREDLYFRLRGVVIRIPPLRERQEDIPILAHELLEDANRKFGKKVRGITNEVLDLFLRYPWPGNIREFKSVMATAVITEREESLSPRNNSLQTLTAADPVRPAVPGGESGPIYTMEEMERRHILSALRHAKGSKAEACRLLKISRPTLDRKIARFGIDLGRLEEE